MTYKEISKILYSQFVTDSRTWRTGLMMMTVLVRVIALASLLTVVTCLPAVFDIIPARRVETPEVSLRPTFIIRINNPTRPCLQLRSGRRHSAKCQEKIKRKRLRKCFRAWLEKNGRIGRHRNALLPCLYFRER